MPIRFEKSVARFNAVAEAEEAEPLLEWLQKHPKGRVHAEECTHMHGAVLQVLMAARPQIAGWPKIDDLRMWLEAALVGEGGA